ncbi:hypothetical protein BLOT_012882, partial [Blomia tropicalis]
MEPWMALLQSEKMGASTLGAMQMEMEIYFKFGNWVHSDHISCPSIQNSSISIKIKNQNIQLRTILTLITKVVDQLFYLGSFWLRGQKLWISYFILDHSGFDDENCGPLILSWIILASITKTVDQLSYLGSFWYASMTKTVDQLSYLGFVINIRKDNMVICKVDVFCIILHFFFSPEYENNKPWIHLHKENII